MFRLIIVAIAIAVSSVNAQAQEIVQKDGKLFRKICDGISCRLEPISREGRIEAKEAPVVADPNTVTPGINTEEKVIPWMDKQCKARPQQSRMSTKRACRLRLLPWRR